MDQIYQDVLFSESHSPNVTALGEVRVDIHEKWFGGDQLTLDDVKTALAKKVKTLRGDALMKFEYGQKHIPFWSRVFSPDAIAWWGKGIAGKRH